jgi:hypothetical protein
MVTGTQAKGSFGCDAPFIFWNSAQIILELIKLLRQVKGHVLSLPLHPFIIII